MMMAEDKEDFDFGKKILDMEMPLKNFISEEEKETSWKEILLAVEGGNRKQTSIRSFYWAAAAAVLIIIGVGVWHTADRGFSTGDHEKLTAGLADGSSVTINYKSRLDVAHDFGEKDRRVSLLGEAFFTIQRDASKPFIVGVGAYEVMVVGTSFNVAYRGGLAEITVRSGTVQLRANDKTLVLKAGQKGVISGAGELSVAEWDVNDFAWYSEILILKGKSLQEVAAILSKLFNRTVEVSPAIASCTLSAKIEYETIDDILTVVKETLGVEWRSESNKIYIDGKGC